MTSPQNIGKTIDVSVNRHVVAPALGAQGSKRGAGKPEGRVPQSTPRTEGETVNPVNSAAIRLLRLESELRKVKTIAAWQLFVANETRQVTQSQQTFVFRLNYSGSLRVEAASALAVIDRFSPLVTWMQAIVDELSRRSELANVREFDIGSIGVAPGIDQPAYPLCFVMWVPFSDLNGRIIGGMLQAKSRPWLESEVVLSKHVAEACGHALVVIGSLTSKPFWFRRLKARYAAAGLLALLAVGAFPVAMTALAPVEVVGKGAFIISAPLEGVVDSVLISPNEPVKKGQVLVRFSDTVLRNRLDLAEREVLVADAKLRKSGQLAFVDPRGRHELAIAQAELELRRTERDYARDLLDRSTVKAERDGVAIFSDPKDLVGRPVSVGERLMEIANPSELEFKIDLPVSDAIIIREGAKVKVFLDSDPLSTIDARLIRADYQAKLRENQNLAFRLVADGLGPLRSSMRLGVRGTAQVYSEKVSLAFYLFRRPIAAARQWIGM